MAVVFNDLGDLLSSSGSIFAEDMRDYTLLQVMQAYQAHKRRTHKDYTINSSIAVIENLEKEYHVTIMPERVTSQFYSLLNERLLNKGIRPSTIHKYFQQIRTCLKFSIDYGVRVHPTYGDFEPCQYEREKVALTPNQVSHLYYFDLNTVKCRADHRKTLEKVKDMFCLSCCLGQRYSDMVRLCPEWFDTTRTILKLSQQKTGNTARVDICKYAIDKEMALEILEKYGYRAPFPGDLSNYERYLKKFMRLVGGRFHDIKSNQVKVAGVIRDESEPVWKMVTSHTARRTFVSVNVKRGFTETEIRRCTGHKSTASFARYVIFDD